MKDLILKNKEFIFLFIIVALFFLIRFTAVGFPYHQDEYKWPLYAYNIGYEPGAVPHPPLSEYIYRATGQIFSPLNFRLTPFIFSLVNLVLIYVYVRRKWGLSPALWASSLFTLSFYGLLASMTVDTDGAILPFFFLLSIIFYELFYDSAGNKKIIWLSLMSTAMILGLLVKISFSLGILAILLDFIIRERKKINKKYLINFVFVFIIFIFLVGFLMFISKFIFEGFSLDRAFSYWDTFVKGFSDRNFFQTMIQFIKAILYTSPFVLFLTLYSLRSHKKDFLLFYLFISIGLIFYLFAFDFSIGALDRYFAFWVVPTSIICGVVAHNIFKNSTKINKKYLSIASILFITIYFLQKVSHHVPPLHPKSEWIDRAMSFQWNFLYPFSGGSGPSGFYISFLFISLCWLSGLVLFVWLIKSNDKIQPTILAIFILLGLFYNGTFISEYLMGINNGSSPRLTLRAVEFIENNQDIQNVLVYNDTGGFNVRMIDKYYRRMYAVPDFEKEYEQIFNNFSGHVLYVNIPRVYDGLYADYMDSCKEIYSETDKYITAKVLDCRK